MRFVACEMAMGVMGLERQELLDGVETAGVASFAALSEKSGTTLFLWNVHRLTFALQLASAVALVAALWLVGWLSGRAARTGASVFSR